MAAFLSGVLGASQAEARELDQGHPPDRPTTAAAIVLPPSHRRHYPGAVVRGYRATVHGVAATDAPAAVTPTIPEKEQNIRRQPVPSGVIQPVPGLSKYSDIHQYIRRMSLQAFKMIPHAAAVAPAKNVMLI